MKLKNWLLAFRPKTLTAAVVPIFVGASLAQAFGQLNNVWMPVFALLSALSIQIATNLINDAIDFHKGADTEHRLGPKRVTQSGVFSSRAVMGAGFFFLLLAVLFGIPLVLEGGTFILWIGIPSLFLAYAYTGGPFPLAYLGLGDLFVFLFFGLIAVYGVSHLSVSEWSPTFTLSSLIAGTQVGMLCTVIIAVNNMRDIHQDKLANKKTLGVRFGVEFVRIEIALLVLLSFLGGAYWWWSGYRFAALLPLLICPLAIKLVAKIRTAQPSAQMNALLAQSAALHLGFGVLLSVGLLLG